MSTFYRLVREGEIQKYLPEGRVQDAMYNKVQVDDLVQYGTPAKRRKRGARQQNSDHPLQTTREGEQRVQVSLFEEDDQPAVYYMESELLTVKHTLPPPVIWSWQSKNDHVYWLLHNPSGRKESKDIWGTLGVLPLREGVLLQVLHGELRVQDIPAPEVLSYESGHMYSCLIVSANVRPEKRTYLHQLTQSVLDYWSSQSIYIDKLYTLAHESLEETAALRIIREYFFAPRYDLLSPQRVWELRFDLWNPSPVIQQFAQQQKDKQMAAISGKTYKQAKVPPARYVIATTEDEIGATVDIDNELFGIPDVPKADVVALRKTWSHKEPEIFHVLKANNRIVGYHSMVALPPAKILKILKEEEHPRDIKPGDIMPFQPAQPLDIYIIVTALKSGLSQREEGIYSGRLLHSISKQFQSLGRRGVIIRKVFGRSRTPDGIKIMRDMGFSELEFSPVHGKHLFAIDIATSDEPFIRPYQHALEEYRHSMERR